MGKPVSLLGQINAFARDFARGQMPPGYAWDLVDYVPSLLDTQLTGRGGWKWGSAVCPADLKGGIYAPFINGDRLLVVDSAGNMQSVDLVTQAVSSVGAVGPIAQNPVMHRDNVYVARSDNTVPRQVKMAAGGAYTITALPTTNVIAGKYAAVYKDRLLLANAPGFETRLAFSPPGDPMAATSIGGVPAGQWDQYSYFNASLPLTGIGALRSVILLFHSGSVERIRGSIPPTTADPLGDMFMEPLYDRAGCGDAHSIAYWQDNCIFADGRGVWLSDGSIVRNLASQGGILTYWRTLYANMASIAADTFLDYYIVTVIRTDNVAITLVCDLNRRSWFRLTNIRASAYIHSVGAQDKLWGCRQGANRLVSLSQCFFPTFVGVQQDDDGTPVLPVIETPFYTMGRQVSRKRIRFVYATYDIRTTDPTAIAAGWRGQEDGEGQVLEAFEASEQNGVAAQVLAKLLEVGYILQPADSTYTIAGTLPETTNMRRFRLPVGRHPLGIGFRLRQTAGSHVTRLFDVEVEAWAEEGSRVATTP